jgi:hypothetical protein
MITLTIVVGLGFALVSLLLYSISKLQRNALRLKMEERTELAADLNSILLEVMDMREKVARTTGYVRYLRAIKWREDPTFIEDLSEGSQPGALKWHELQDQYGIWVREESGNEGEKRAVRSKETDTRELLPERRRSIRRTTDN